MRRIPHRYAGCRVAARWAKARRGAAPRFRRETPTPGRATSDTTRQRRSQSAPPAAPADWRSAARAARAARRRRSFRAERAFRSALRSRSPRPPQQIFAQRAAQQLVQQRYVAALRSTRPRIPTNTRRDRRKNRGQTTCEPPSGASAPRRAGAPSSARICAAILLRRGDQSVLLQELRTDAEIRGDRAEVAVRQQTRLASHLQRAVAERRGGFRRVQLRVLVEEVKNGENRGDPRGHVGLCERNGETGVRVKRRVRMGRTSGHARRGKVKSWKKRISMRSLCAGAIPREGSRCSRLLEAGRHVVARK